MTRQVYLYLIRHGQSEWNLSNQYSGWRDMSLTKLGQEESLESAIALEKAIEKNGPIMHLYTSALSRAQQTTDIVQKNVKALQHLKVNATWKFNERHYGGLQGLVKSETAKKYGEEQVQLWRRSYDVPVPTAEEGSINDPKTDPKYADVDRSELPLFETLKMVIEKRVVPYFVEQIEPKLLKGENIVIISHGNTTRAIVMNKKPGMTEDDILNFEVPTGIPLQIRFIIEDDDKLVFDEMEFLADEEKVKAMQDKVRNQGKAAK